MSAPLRLLGCLAHPDDESLGTGGTFACYAGEGIETYLLTATFGDRGRYKGVREGPDYPGREGMAKIREHELHAAARVLGVHEVIGLGYRDGDLDQAPHAEVVGKIATVIRRVRPQVVFTFAGDGSYGHPDHVAISQFTTAAIVRAAAADAGLGGDPHVVSKLYWLAWPQSSMDAYTESARLPHPIVDGVERHPVSWPDWQITTRIETLSQMERVWQAVRCHDSQSASWEGLDRIKPENRAVIWGHDSYYRVFSLVNGGREPETDLFAGLR
jgi:LmbE family N-acetylglucosaminyl deacetylase